MKKLLLGIAAIACLSVPAYAARTTSTITTTTGLATIATLTGGEGGTVGNEYSATVTTQGTFNGNTIHFLVSVDGGTTKVPVNDLTGVAYTQTAAGTVDLEYEGWPQEASKSVIFYASVGGDSPGAPTLTITVDDNR